MQQQTDHETFASLLRAGPAAWFAIVRSAGVRDYAWAAFMALLLGVSPITGAGRPLAAAVLGIVGGVGLFLVRVFWRAVDPPRSTGPAIARPGIPIAALLLAVFVLTLPTLSWLYSQYIESIWRNPHGFFVALFAALMIRHRLREDPDKTPDSSPWGLVVVVLGAALIALDAGARSHYVAVVGALILIPGLLLLTLGTRRVRMLGFPLVFCLFLLPVPDGMSDPLYLPTFSSEIGTSMVRAIGIPVTRVGTRIAIEGGGGIEVTQNCSGLSAFFSGCALAYLCLGYTRSTWRRVAIVLAPYLLTAVSNGVRVAVLIWIGRNHGLDWKFDTPLHGILGTVAYLAVMVGIWWLSDKRALREALA